MKDKNLYYVIWLSTVLLVCSFIISNALTSTKNENTPTNRYTVVGITGNRIVIHDNETGKIYSEFLDSNEAPTNQQELQLP